VYVLSIRMALLSSLYPMPHLTVPNIRHTATFTDDSIIVVVFCNNKDYTLYIRLHVKTIHHHTTVEQCIVIVLCNNLDNDFFIVMLTCENNAS